MQIIITNTLLPACVQIWLSSDSLLKYVDFNLDLVINQIVQTELNYILMQIKNIFLCCYSLTSSVTVNTNITVAMDPPQYMLSKIAMLTLKI